MKKLLLLATVLALTACGGGGGGGTENSVATPSPSVSAIDYSNQAIYPTSNTVSFRSHTTADIFKMSDASAWKITGTTNSSYNTGTVTSNVTISLATNSTPNPVAGSRSPYFLVGSGINPAFFVEPIPMTKLFSTTAVFRSHSTGDIFMLSDESAWQITGTSNSSYNTGSTVSDVTVYSSNTNTPNPSFGNRADYYLIGNGINPAFFIKQLPMTPVTRGTVDFKSQSTGDIFLLSNGTSWKIMGTSNSSYNTGKISSNVVIYSSNSNTPDPMSGERSSHYLIGQGINPAFYVTQL